MVEGKFIGPLSFNELGGPFIVKSMRIRPNKPPEAKLLHGLAMEAGLPVYPPTGIKVTVIGGGFVGLVTAAGFAQFGHSVSLIEKSPEKLEELRAGNVRIYERSLPELVRANLGRKRLTFLSEPVEAVQGSKAIFMAVGTPSLPNGEADLSAVFEAVESIAPFLESKQVIVLKSTVPVGTASRLRRLLSENGVGGKGIAIASNPEFLREGTAVLDFFRPQRIVIGGDRPEAIETVAQLYRVGIMESCLILMTNNETAEMIKYASNLFLATKVAFVNELANLCDATGVNVTEVTRGMGLDSRISPEFLNPGPGFGGSCLPKDLEAVLNLAKKHGVELSIASAVKEANRRQPEKVVKKLEELAGDLKGKTIGVLGLAFKAHTNDLRDSPALAVMKKLEERGAFLQAYDPVAETEARAIWPALKLAPSPSEVAEGADALVLLTEWPEFMALNWEEIGQKMKTRKIVDARNLLVPVILVRHGFAYSGMGQKAEEA